MLSSISWKQLDTETLCRPVIYSGIPALATHKANITLVLFPAVQRLHASSLQTPLFSYASIAPPWYQTRHTRKREQYFEWEPQILTGKKSDVNLKKKLCEVPYWYFPKETPPFLWDMEKLVVQPSFSWSRSLYNKSRNQTQENQNK